MKNASSHWVIVKIDEEEPTAVSRLISWLVHKMTLLKTRLVGTEAVEVTDGQLDPKPGEGGERPDKIQPNRFVDQKTGN